MTADRVALAMADVLDRRATLSRPSFVTSIGLPWAGSRSFKVRTAFEDVIRCAAPLHRLTANERSQWGPNPRHHHPRIEHGTNCRTTRRTICEFAQASAHEAAMGGERRRAM
jgi:hypothetical protein